MMQPPHHGAQFTHGFMTGALEGFARILGLETTVGCHRPSEVQSSDHQEFRDLSKPETALGHSRANIEGWGMGSTPFP